MGNPPITSYSTQYLTPITSYTTGYVTVPGGSYYDRYDQTLRWRGSSVQRKTTRVDRYVPGAGQPPQPPPAALELCCPPPSRAEPLPPRRRLRNALRTRWVETKRQQRRPARRRLRAWARAT